MTIVADNKIPFLQGALESHADIRYLPAKEITHERVKDADALIIRTRTVCNAELLEHTNVKFIATATIGYDHIDASYCRENNIRWVSAPGCNSSSVMQYVASALLALAKEKSVDLSKRTLGIVGVGNVGKKVARLAELLGMDVLCNDPPRMRTESGLDFVSLDEILAECDIITLHVPLTHQGADTTYRLVNEDFFSQVKKGTILLNTSRGAVVDSSALKQAIKSGTVGATILDVWEHEPEIDRELLQLVDIATPHIAGYSADGKANGTSVCVRAVSDFFNLEMPASWYPEIPQALQAMNIVIYGNGKSLQEILYEACLRTYDIRFDDAKLRQSPETFEQQRSDYYVRREFPCYEIVLQHPEREAEFALRNLGFTLINTEQ
ncbi:MAG: 4-phosphoerythronate dehydrogenase PdxB [Bacteroidetes bacterium]|nr:MAG: 4-phosphoerythronate dehydrogenase PdxB [Bacteroidota bacterium]